MSGRDEVDGWTDDLRVRLDELLEEYRSTLLGSLDGLSEEEARTRLVPSKTTLLGLVKHVTYVEGVWFDQALLRRDRHRHNAGPLIHLERLRLHHVDTRRL